MFESNTAAYAFSKGPLCAGVAVDPSWLARSTQVEPSAELYKDEPRAHSCEFHTTRGLYESQQPGYEYTLAGTSPLHFTVGVLLQLIPDSSDDVRHRSK